MKSISGFSGRGFKFDETEEAMAKERKQIQKAALGLQDSDEEEPAQNVSTEIKIIVGSLCFSKSVFICPVTYPASLSCFLFFFKHLVNTIYSVLIDWETNRIFLKKFGTGYRGGL